MDELSPRQREILAYIDHNLKTNGYPPTLREICKKFSISSTNGARYHIHQLKKLGYLQIEPGKSRGVKRLNEDEMLSQRRSYILPVLGKVPAGPFNFASPDLREDELIVDPEYFGGRQEEPELFGLRIKGDSMMGDGIYEGDIVVVRSQDFAKDGDIVVARYDDEATVKRYRRKSKEVVLEPSNPSYDPIRIKDRGGREYGQDLAVLGVVVGLIRSI